MAEGTAAAPLENGGGGDSGVGALERGVAPIKPQYLTTKEQFHQFLEAKGQEKPCRETELDIRGKLYLAPLTTCGNLPFRRICKRFGADVTCGEMAVCTNLLQGQMSEWALLKRHQCEDIFGVQLEGAFPDTMTKCAELLSRTVEVDFVDINVGCPIDLVYKKGGGCALMNRSTKFQQIVRGMNQVLDVPLTVKIRTGVQERVNLAHRLLPELRDWGVALVTLHGRSREQRYTKLADWQYIEECVKAASPMPLFGNGDILSFEDANRAMQTGVAGIMIARGALLKPWLFTEIKEQRHWDISSSERLDILRDFTNYGLEHWGSDTQGVEKTRRFLLEWLSFLCRYVPVGLLERLPQRINERPPYYLGRDYLETLMASQKAADWIRISEMLLGPVPPNFAFLPKHKANAYK
uniref:tRNA-dihydrouridine(47) synthase [NAD(P)(+)] n=1 Tax=Nomascus leucogenys TaxID=61853 RepID=A0A2I3GRH8_NOMLE